MCSCIRVRPNKMHAIATSLIMKGAKTPVSPHKSARGVQIEVKVGVLFGAVRFFITSSPILDCVHVVTHDTLHRRSLARGMRHEV